MPASLPGFEYDIFISYRQNDNRSAWVTEFVSTLEEELSAAIKHPVSVYFDSNPNHGLQESHNVDKSLEGKLKCLIFIPVISQTYCDPNSFAWQHEFVAFNRLAQADDIGRDIKLHSGNVASRILPIKIHEIDDDDRKFIEVELSGPFRSIDFTFRSAGVNRPLRPNDDDILYRNQVNKTANSIKDLLAAMRNSAGTSAPAATRAQSIIKPARRFTQRLRQRIAISFGALLFALLAGYLVFYISTKPTPTQEIPSIAVLPFVDMSLGKDQAYLGDGLAEAVINSLTTIQDLKVVGRTSSFQFKDQNIDLRKIGEALGVGVVLEGSVQKSGNRIRITAQLIDVSNNMHLWSEQYDRQLDDIFKIQDDIAKNIIENLKGTLLGSPTPGAGTTNALAYEMYLKGVYELATYSGEGTRNAIRLFEQTIALDSTFADVYTGIAMAHIYRAAIFMSEISGEEATALARPYFQKSLRINPHHGLAHNMLGFIHLYQDRDLEAAEKEYRTALEFEPNNPDILGIYSDFLNFTRRHDEALILARRQAEIEPFYPNGRLPFALFYLGREQEALEFQKGRLKVIDSYWNHDIYGFLNLNTGNYQEAIASCNKAMDIVKIRTPRMLGWMGAAHAKSGNKAEAMKLLKELETLAARGNAGSPAFFMAVVQTALGDNTAALSSLERAEQAHDWEMPWIISEPQFYPLHGEERFKEVARKVGFAAYIK